LQISQDGFLLNAVIKASLHLSDQESRPEVIYQGLKLCSGIPGGNHYKGKKGRKRRR
jgi:hypothetical protein